MPLDPGTGVDMSPEEFWDLHGTSLYSLARALTGDDTAALRVMPTAMADLYSSAGGQAPMPTEITLETAAACVYARCRAGLAEAPRRGTRANPLRVVAFGELEGARRAALALCVFGGHTYHQAAARLEMPPEVAAGLLTSGLRDLWAATLRADTTG